MQSIRSEGLLTPAVGKTVTTSVLGPVVHPVAGTGTIVYVSVWSSSVGLTRLSELT